MFLIFTRVPLLLLAIWRGVPGVEVKIYLNFYNRNVNFSDPIIVLRVRREERFPAGIKYLRCGWGEVALLFGALHFLPFPLSNELRSRSCDLAKRWNARSYVTIMRNYVEFCRKKLTWKK